MSTKGFSITDLDTTAEPGDNFFRYAVGGWLKHNPIPPEYSRWGTFELLIEDNYNSLRTLLEHPNEYQQSPLSEIAHKTSLFYTVAMDESRIEAAGFTPIASELARVRALTAVDNLAKEIAIQHRYNGSPLFNFYATPDAKNSAYTIAGFGQGGLGLPDRDYYVLDEPRYVQTRERYVQHITKMFTLVQYTETKSAQAAEAVFAIEKVSVQELITLSPTFNWSMYMHTIGLSEVHDVDVGQLHFFEKLSNCIRAHSLEAWQAYLEWNIIRSMGGTLSNSFVNERFDFYGRFLNGQEVLKPRFKRIIDATNASMGQAVGQLYVDKHFTPNAKASAIELVKRLLHVTGKRINRLTWMADKTKQAALEKLSAIKVKIGYPDKWIDYNRLDIQNDSYSANVMRAHSFEFDRQLAKVNKPTDPDEWFMDPQDVNAYYDQQRNEIVFPAAILQPPFFSDTADEALNYGAIGGVIGHEITHGFDDQGRKYDANGNLHDWWTPEDAERFSAEAQKLISQYNGYTIETDLHVNGEFTLGENIADLGGMSIAYEALQDALAEKPQRLIDSFTQEQRFFLSWAQSWKQNVRPELAKLYIVADPHSPPECRVNGPMSNFAQFFEVFKITPESPMYRSPAERAIIW